MVRALSETLKTGLEPAGGAARKPARGRLLITDLRGSGRIDPVYTALAALGWQITVLHVPEPSLLRWSAMARSFRPSLPRWRQRFQRSANRLARTAFAFRYKSRLCRRLVAKSGARYDLILHEGGMFAPGWPLPATSYAVCCDCTVKLGEGHALSGVDFASPASARRFFAMEEMLYRNAGCIFSTSDFVRRSLIEDYGVDPGRV